MADEGVHTTRPPRILVVDDSFDHRVIADGFLSAAGYRVSHASSGQQALRMLDEEGLPHLICLDIRMPEMDGIELTRRLRAREDTAQVPVLIVTASPDPDLQRAALDAGADDYLVKPLRRIELLMRVRSLLRIRALNEDLRRRNRLIEQQRDQLIDAMQLRQQLFSMVVHDLKNPLAGVRGNMRMLLQGQVKGEDARATLQDVDEAAEWMQRMVLQILDLTRAADGGLETAKELVSVRDLLELVAAPARRQLAELDRTIELRVPASAADVWADFGLLRRLVANLLDNAGRFAPRGSVVSLRASNTGSAWRLEVIDRGVGVQLDKRDLIFEPYATLESGARSRGLGLAFCRLAVEAHDGCIGVDDVPGGGSCFWVELPLPPG